MIYFDLDPGIIKENCKFHFFYNKIDVTPTILDGGNEIILVNLPNDKHKICSLIMISQLEYPAIHVYL